MSPQFKGTQFAELGGECDTCDGGHFFPPEPEEVFFGFLENIWSVWMDFLGPMIPCRFK